MPVTELLTLLAGGMVVAVALQQRCRKLKAWSMTTRSRSSTLKVLYKHPSLSNNLAISSVLEQVIVQGIPKIRKVRNLVATQGKDVEDEFADGPAPKKMLTAPMVSKAHNEKLLAALTSHNFDGIRTVQEQVIIPEILEIHTPEHVVKTSKFVLRELDDEPPSLEELIVPGVSQVHHVQSVAVKTSRNPVGFPTVRKQVIV